MIELFDWEYPQTPRDLFILFKEFGGGGSTTLPCRCAPPPYTHKEVWNQYYIGGVKCAHCIGVKCGPNPSCISCHVG